MLQQGQVFELTKGRNRDPLGVESSPTPELSFVSVAALIEHPR
jgi:hypothetical protein